MNGDLLKIQYVKRSSNVFVVCDILGPMAAGVGRAAMFLADELARTGLHVVAYTAQPQRGIDGRLCEIAQVRTAWVQRGCRFNFPNRCLVTQILLDAFLKRPDFIIVIGMTYITRSLLAGPMASRVAVWETTNANMGNKFIDEEAVRNIYRCLAILSPSDTIDRGIRKTYAYQGSIVRLPYWIPDISSLPREKVNPLKYDFVYLGRLDVEKGINELIIAFAALKKKRLGRLAICGFGKAEPFQRKAKELGIAESVDIYPNASEETVENIMQSARWYVLPSYHEGYPLSILEAARRGIPIIATSVGSVLEMVGRSEAALLIPPRNIDALVSVMEYTSSESELEYARRCKAACHVFSQLSSAAVVRDHVTSAVTHLLSLPKKVKQSFC